jgi:purine nucleoside permease
MMRRSIAWFWSLCVLSVLFAASPALSTNSLGAASFGGAAAFPVRVLVITMFSLETAPWLQRERLPMTFRAPGAFGPVRCNPTGLCVTTIGEGKSNAAASMMAILLNPQFSFARSYFLTAGIAGTPPAIGTLGFAAWARWVVDWDLGHHLLPQTAPGTPYGYLRVPTGTNVFRLNGHLANLAYQVTRGLKLVDTAEAAANRTHYPGQAGKHPYVTLCDTVTGDDYWAGQTLSQEAQYITGLWTKGQGRYCTTEMEDTAVATALHRLGYLNRYLDLRTASDFDQPYAGQSVTAALQAFPGAVPAFANAYLVGSTMEHYLLAHPNA